MVRACGGRGVELVLLTHTHVDHAEGARAFAGRVGAPLAALAPGWASPGAPDLAAGDPVAAAGLELRPLPTPGHAADHCCFELAADRAVFTGDHVLGRGTTVVEWPGGDMGDYLASLELLLELRPERLYPGHGPLVPDAVARVEGYLAHRLDREAQVLAALGRRRPHPGRGRRPGLRRRRPRPCTRRPSCRSAPTWPSWSARAGWPPTAAASGSPRPVPARAEPARTTRGPFSTGPR